MVCCHVMVTGEGVIQVETEMSEHLKEEEEEEEEEDGN